MCNKCGDSGIKYMKTDPYGNMLEIIYCDCVKHHANKKEKPINGIIG
jgi:hypothetical protein